MKIAIFATTLFACFTTRLSSQESTSVPELVQQVIRAAGGESKLFKLFRMKEQYNAGETLLTPGTPRTSVVEPPTSWWINNKERGVEPAKITTWAWTLGALTDPKSKIDLLADMTDNEKNLSGLRITGTVDPALDMYFDKETQQLIRVDWRDDIYRFSDWKDCDGTKYPSKCVMFRRQSGAPWFFHEILELERLKELPVDLKR